jgi:hypothetical protein
MDRPERVSRVTPPTTTIANTSAQQISSQVATYRRARLSIAGPAAGAGAMRVECMGCMGCIVFGPLGG